MNVEDRVRAATLARVELVREIRPLEIPERLPHRARRAPRPQRLIGWVAPVTAAAVVVALAITLASVRQATHDSGVSGLAQVTPASAAAIPRYSVSVRPELLGARSPAAATVTDTRTGAVLASVRPPAHRQFAGVTGAADDRTFVVDTTPASGTSGRATHVWYLLRIAPGTGHPASLTRLPIADLPVSAQIQGLALSPDARSLAVLLAMPENVTLRTYSLATGNALRTWTTRAPRPNAATIPDPENIAALSWVGEHRLAFRYPGDAWPDHVRMLNTASKRGDLLKASRSVMADPGDQHHCASLLTATDGKTVACGTLGNATGGCVKEEPEFTLWSTATGKVTRVLYRYNGTCQAGFGSVLWAGAHGTMIGVIVAETISGKHAHIKFTAGLISHGKFTPLHVPVSATEAVLPGEFAF